MSVHSLKPSPLKIAPLMPTKHRQTMATQSAQPSGTLRRRLMIYRSNGLMKHPAKPKAVRRTAGSGWQGPSRPCFTGMHLKPAAAPPLPPQSSAAVNR